MNDQPEKRDLKSATRWMREDLDRRLARRRAIRAINAPLATRVFAKILPERQN